MGDKEEDQFTEPVKYNTTEPKATGNQDPDTSWGDEGEGND